MYQVYQMTHAWLLVWFVSVVFASCHGWSVENNGIDTWPPRVAKKCTRSTKQTAMYGRMYFSPTLGKKPMVDMKVWVEWNDLQFAPYNRRKTGGVYIAYTTGVKGGPHGYFGVQIHAKRGSFIFSIWDSDRWSGRGHSRKPKPSSKLVWPLNMKRCHRNCQDCGLPGLRPWKKKGLTTGTQCGMQYPSMKVGDRFELSLKRTRKMLTIQTSKYGGMPKAHALFGEVDRNITGGVWVVKARNTKTDVEEVIGEILFEGDGSGMISLGTFDEMLGCNDCNMIYHKDTRYGPFINDTDGTTRRPLAMSGLTKPLYTKCKKYGISGSKKDVSLSFESGPLTKETFYGDGKSHKVW